MKRKLVNTILVEFYPRGLNTLQLAQIDVQLLVDKPSVNSWVSSTAKVVSSTSDIPEHGDKTREKKIVSNKSDSKRSKAVTNGVQRQIQIQNKPQIIPHKPFYILLPISSPHVIHTPPVGDSVDTKLILQTLETTLSHTNVRREAQKNNTGLNSSILTKTKIKIFPDSDVPTPIRNLETIFTLKGISRFGSSMGPWTPYADDLVDIGVFGNELRHQALQPEQYVDLGPGEDYGTEQAGRERVAALKFKGGMWRAKSKEFSSAQDKENYEQDTQAEHDFPQNDQVDDGTREVANDAYASVVPIHECNFEIENTLSHFFRQRKRKANVQKTPRRNPAAKDSSFRFKMSLFGSDVFGGLHELAVNKYVNPYEIPDWLTGESGTIGGVVKNGRFRKKT
ncbi:hypothetical protein PMKS-002038 [Pichia membranifaciens]|uniref:Uncharacterized protein n=1 Tax=Pichia membranifaciens TaxID=4926 RepID=A0A1Q2YG76_9ASCO|nr:hypothetical protein PMKS-002038 [Pichia membranifaciens]